MAYQNLKSISPIPFADAWGIHLLTGTLWPQGPQRPIDSHQQNLATIQPLGLGLDFIPILAGDAVNLEFVFVDLLHGSHRRCRAVSAIKVVAAVVAVAVDGGAGRRQQSA